ncbi:hypothetical protein HK101_008320 [Irineochytrium annulatum]|nr:hypothetical protein HK101_008320 [Irineochytrium annulatum]
MSECPATDLDELILMPDPTDSKAPAATTTTVPATVDVASGGLYSKALLQPSNFTSGPADVSEIGMATVFGATAGFATKKITKTGALIVGVSFMTLQALSHADIIKVNWPRIEQMVIGKVDQDGDGKITNNDVRVMGLR